MQIVLRWILYLTVLSLVALLVVLAVNDTVAQILVTWLTEVINTQGGRMALAGVGAFLLAVQALLVARWLTLRRYAREIGYQNEFGKVSVSLVAIEEALTRAIEGEAGVRRVSLSVYEDRVKRTVVIEPVLTLWEDINVTAVNHRCQEVLRARFAELMPERTQVQVNLTLHRLNQRPAAHERSRRGTSQAPAVSLPVAGDEHGGGATTTALSPALGYDGTHAQESRTESAVMDQADSHDQVGEGDWVGKKGQGVTVAERIRSARLAAVSAASQRRLSEVEDEEDLDYDSLYAGPTYPVDKDDDGQADGDTAEHRRRGSW